MGKVQARQDQNNDSLFLCHIYLKVAKVGNPERMGKKVWWFEVEMEIEIEVEVEVEIEIEVEVEVEVEVKGLIALGNVGSWYHECCRQHGGI